MNAYSFVPANPPDGRGRATTAGDLDPFADRLNKAVVQHLSSATLGLFGLAAGCDEPEQLTRLLACIDELDATIARIRATLIDPSDVNGLGGM